jgi:hypothetical protein
VGARLTTEGTTTGKDKTEEDKRKALEALESRGNRHDAATAADVSPLKVERLAMARRGFAVDWDATIDRVMKRLREQPLYEPAGGAHASRDS